MGKLWLMHVKSFTKLSKKLQILNSRSKWKLHYQIILTASKNQIRNLTIEFWEIQVFPATHHDYIESLHTYNDCIKYSESTVGTGTQVKPVLFTVNIFEVQVSACICSLWNFHLKTAIILHKVHQKQLCVGTNWLYTSILNSFWGRD